MRWVPRCAQTAKRQRRPAHVPATPFERLEPRLLLSGNTWLASTIDYTDDVGRYTSLAVDGSGDVHVAYYDATNLKLKYARLAGDSLTPEVIESVGEMNIGDNPQAVLTPLSLALDAEDRPCIAYATDRGGVKLVTLDQAGWQEEEVPTSGAIDLSLTFDAEGRPHLSLFKQVEQDYKDLVHAYRDAWGSWYTEDVEVDGTVGQANSIALATDGTVTISYYCDNAAFDGYKVARWDPVHWAWSDWEIAAASSTYNPYGTSLALDADGTPVVSYGLANADSGNEIAELHLARWDGGDWQDEVVDDSVIGKYSSLLLAGDSDAHISYYDVNAGSLLHAFRQADAWEIETVDHCAPLGGSGELGGLGLYSSLAARPDGSLVVSYYDQLNGDLKVACQSPQPLPRLFAALGYGSSDIAELDLTDGSVVNRFPRPVGGEPWNDPEGLAFDGHSLFYMAADGVLYELDPDTGAVLDEDTVTAGSGVYDGLAASGEGVYIGDILQHQVHLFDPIADTVIETLDVASSGNASGPEGGLAALTDPDRLVTMAQPQGLSLLDIETGALTEIGAMNNGEFVPGLASVQGLLYASDPHDPEGPRIRVFDESGTHVGDLQLEFAATALAAGLVKVVGPSGPAVVDVSPIPDPSGMIAGVRVVFDQPIRTDSFDLEDVTVLDPGRGAVTLSRIEFPAGDRVGEVMLQELADLGGSYRVTVGPDILGLNGEAMDQDGDGVPGQPGDRYVTEILRASVPCPGPVDADPFEMPWLHGLGNPWTVAVHDGGCVFMDDEGGPHSYRYHLRMDREGNDGYGTSSYEEIVFHIDLSSNGPEDLLVLEFWGKMLGEEGLSQTVVSITDGLSDWADIDVCLASTHYNQWRRHVLPLWDWIEQADLRYEESFQIRFRHTYGAGESSSFLLDDFQVRAMSGPPTVQHVSPAPGATVAAGAVTCVIEFNEPLPPQANDLFDITLSRSDGGSFTPSLREYDPTGLTFVLEYPDLPAGRYTLMISDPGSNIDGDFDGLPGGDYQTEFTCTIPGDANADWHVDALDYLTLKLGLGAPEASWAQGDFDGDGTVSGADMDELGESFNRMVVSTTADVCDDIPAPPDPSGGEGVLILPGDDDPDDDEPISDGLLSLREAIREANASGADSLIRLPAGTYELTEGQLALRSGSGATRIQGPAGGQAVVDALGNSRVLLVEADTSVELTGITLQNGDAPVEGGEGVLLPLSDPPDPVYGGGGLRNSGSLRMTDCQILDSRTVAPSPNPPNPFALPYERGEGGGVYNEGTLTLSDCTVQGNEADDGGGIYNTGTLTVTATALADNAASSGTVVWVFEPWNPPVVEGAGDGGGLYNEGVAVLTGSAVTGGRAGRGAGVYNAHTGDLHLDGCSVWDNTASYGSGAGVYNLGTAALLSSTVSTNRAMSMAGIANAGEITLVNATVADNTNDAYSASGYEMTAGLHNSGTATMYNTVLSGNMTEYTTPGLYVPPDQIDLGGEGEFVAAHVLVGVAAPECPLTTGPIEVYVGSPELPGLAGLGELNTDVFLPYHPLLAGSAAIDGGGSDWTTQYGLALDQLGLPRVADGDGNGQAFPDLGAVEVQP